MHPPQLCVFSPQTGHETIEIAEREVTVVSTNQSERQVASAKSIGKTSSSRSKSRSPHCKRIGPTSPSSQPGASTSYIPKPVKSSPPPVGRPRLKSSRRPHASAGPRDASNLQFYSERELKEKSIDPGDRVSPSTGPLSKTSSAGQVFRDSHIRTIVHHDGNNHITFQPISLDHVRDWEDELARIELRSRRRTADMLGFRKR